MTTWTLEQISQARNLFVKACIDTDRSDLDLVRKAAAEKMAKAMIHEAHAFAIEMHYGDMAVRWSPDEDRPWQEWGEMRWHPSTTVVEMVGGQADGERVQIQRVGDPIRVATPTPISVVLDPDDSVDLTPLGITYELAGWHETERVWVYNAR